MSAMNGGLIPNEEAPKQLLQGKMELLLLDDYDPARRTIERRVKKISEMKLKYDQRVEEIRKRNEAQEAATRTQTKRTLKTKTKKETTRHLNLNMERMMKGISAIKKRRSKFRMIQPRRAMLALWPQKLFQEPVTQAGSAYLIPEDLGKRTFRIDTI